MNEFLEKIKSRGYWKIIIHPATFDQARIENTAELHRILQKSYVQYPKRRWEFPHYHASAPVQEANDWIGRESEREVYLELWRFYQSGQFVSIKGMYEDWRDNSKLFAIPDGWQPGKFLNVEDTLLQFSEVFDLASSLMFSPVFDAQIRVKISAHNLIGRCLKLVLDGKENARLKTFTTSVNEIPYMIDLTPFKLVGRHRDLALPPAVQLFQQFGWNPGIEYLRDLRDEALLPFPS